MPPATRPDRTYSKAWRDAVRPGAVLSAVALAPVLLDVATLHAPPASVVDVGCGEGHLLDAFGGLGVTKRLGIDGPWVAIDRSHERGFADFAQDEQYPAGLDGLPFDLVCCLEVAEHVPEARAEQFVDWLLALGSLLVFSAAVPGQGGEGHVNEQWPGYWADKFRRRGVAVTGALRWRIWDDERVSWWYRQNLLVVGSSVRLSAEFGAWNDGPAAVIHPGAWAHRGHARWLP